MSNKRFSLQNTFTYSTSTHQFEIKWTQIGDSAKPPLIFIHGTPWSSVTWHDLASVLQDRFCIYLYDHPGFENSPQPIRKDGAEPELDPSLRLRAEASAALFQHWKLTQSPHIIAHDNGGLVSLRLFLEHGIKFASLCLIDVVAIGAEAVPFFELVATNQSVFNAIPANFLEGFIRAYVRGATHSPMHAGIEDMLVAQWLADGAQGPKRFLQELVQAHNRDIGDFTKQYSKVGKEIPVKIIWGADDSWIPSERASRLFTALNASELAYIEDAGHLVHYDQPSKLAFEVGMWLTKHAKS